MATSPFLEKIQNHYENMKVTNQRILAQFKAELRRVNLYDSAHEQDKYQSTCMETINERSKEAEVDNSFQHPPQTDDSELQSALQNCHENNYKTNHINYDPTIL